VGIDLESGDVAWTVPVGERPNSIVITPDGQQALVSSTGGLTVIDLGAQQTSSVPVGSDATDIALSPNGDFGFVVTSGDVVRFDRGPV